MNSEASSSSLSINYLTVNIPATSESKHDLNRVIKLSPMVSVRSPSRSSSHLSHANDTSIHDDQMPTVVTEKSVNQAMATLSFRIHQRKFFSTRLTLVSDLMCLLGLLGILLMVVENEITFRRVNNEDTQASWFIKSIVTSTTAMLLSLICYYHYLSLQLYAVQNALHDYRIGLTKEKIYWIAVEILICAIHPVPRVFPFRNAEQLDSHSASAHSLRYTAVDVGLGLPMFLRLYLIGRSMMFHSHLIRDTAFRSMSALNQVSINFFFLMKTYLEQWPARCLFTFCISVWLIGSWALRACNYTSASEHLPFLDALWLFVITFTTVGYGDLYPSTYCGRSIATLIGLIGLLSSALLITVLTKKLLLTREEKYVHTFVSSTELAKKHRHLAANVVKFSVKVWYLKRRNKSNRLQHTQAQRKLFQAITHLQRVKQQQGCLVDSCVGLHELMMVGRDTRERHGKALQQVTEMKHDMKRMEANLNNLTQTIDQLQTTLTMFLNK